MMTVLLLTYILREKNKMSHDGQMRTGGSLTIRAESQCRTQGYLCMRTAVQATPRYEAYSGCCSVWTLQGLKKRHILC